MRIKNRARVILIAAAFCFSTVGVFAVQTEKYEALLGTWDVET